MRITSILNHAFQAILEGGLIAILVVALIAGTAMAGRGGKVTAPAGSCEITPNPVAVWQEWTVRAWDLPTGSFVDGRFQGTNLHFQVDDGVGVTGRNFYTTDGTWSTTRWSGAAGTTKVTITTATKHQTLVAACTVTVE